MYDPLVIEVLQLLPYDERGNLAAVVGEETPAILIDALTVYDHARRAVRNEVEKLALENAKRESAARRSSRG